MICWNYDKEREEEQLKKFVSAVLRGYTVYAHPDTARLIRRVIPDTQTCEWVERGMVYAIDTGIFERELRGESGTVREPVNDDQLPIWGRRRRW